MMGDRMKQIKDGYKATEIGVIPEDWEVKELASFVEANSYGPRFNAKLYNENGNCRVIRGTDVINNGKVNYRNIPVALIPEEILDKHMLLKNDLVVVTTADCGISFIFNEEGVFMPSAYMVRIRFNSEINPDFVCLFFNTKIIKKQVMSHIRKGTIANLPGSDLLKFKILFPSLLEQQRIAEILSTTDAHIEKLDAIIKGTQLLKKGMMQKLLTLGIGHTEFKDSEIGRIPKVWEVRRLKEITILITKGTTPSSVGFSFQKEGVNFIKVENIDSNGNIDKDSTPKISQKCNNKLSRSIIQKNDILVSIAGTIGRSAIVNSNILPANTNQALAIVRLKNCDTVDTKYVNFTFSSEYFNSYIKAIKTVGAQPNMNLEQLQDYLLALPNIQEQIEISNILSEFDKLLNLYKQEKKDFIQLKRGLMDQLLTGKIRVI